MKFHFGLKISNAVLFCALSVLAVGQQESAFPGIPARVVVTVEARHGKEVPEVRAEDVAVMQGKQRDKVTSWQPVNHVGMQLFLLVDDSLSSVDVGSKLRDIASFINSQPANTLVGVAYMRNGAALIAQQLTSDHAVAAKALRLPIGEVGGTSPYFSLQDLLKRWPESSATREVVMISSGIDPLWDGHDLDDPYLNAAIEDAQKKSVVVNALYARAAGHGGHTFWRINWGQNFLSQLADATGGESYFLGNDSPVSFTPYFDELNQRMGHQFVLAFEAQPGKKSGLERIKLSTEVPNAELVAQQKVYVPVS